MPKINSFQLRLTTGARGRTDVPPFVINGFEVPLEKVTGGCGAGQVLEAEGNPQSFAHALLLRGPSEGAWDVTGFEITYHCGPKDSYSHRFGPATVESDGDLNLFEEKPLPVYDV